MIPPTGLELEARGYRTLRTIELTGMVARYMKWFLDDKGHTLFGIYVVKYLHQGTLWEIHLQKETGPVFKIQLEEPDMKDVEAIEAWFMETYKVLGCCTHEARVMSDRLRDYR